MSWFSPPRHTAYEEPEWLAAAGELLAATALAPDADAQARRVEAAARLQAAARGLIDTVAPGTPPLGPHRGLTVRSPGWGREICNQIT